MCQTPLRLATASSTFLVTCASSSDGAAPDWVISTCTIGMSMLGNRVIDIVRKLTRPSSISTAKATIAGIGLRIDQAETLRRIAELLASVRRSSSIGRTRSPGRRNAAARATRVSPAATPLRISTSSPSTMPGVTLRSSTVRRARPARAASPSRRTAVVGAPTPSRRARSTSPEAKAPMRVRRVGKRDAHLAGAARLVDFLVDEADLAVDRPSTPGRLQCGGHADGEPRQPLLGHFGVEVDRAVRDDAEQRLAGEGGGRRRVWPSGG